MGSPLDRYRPIVDDWTSFEAAIRRPLPTCIWTNPLRVDWEEVRDHLAEEGLNVEPVSWSREAWRVEGFANLTDSLGYRAGVFHLQEEVSQLPVALMALDPTCRVLDLCAAPGGKTALIAIKLGGRGTVVANDPSRGRQTVTRTLLDRLGLANVSLTDRDGRDALWPDASFDRVLVDAPCSCEGTLRKHPGVEERTTESGRAYLVELQRRLLLNALRICRPGGRVVYSTCTFAPEENEAVVSDVLESMQGQVRIAFVPVAGLRSKPGLTEWNGRRFKAEMALAHRLWPHHGDTGGFFAVALERLGTHGAAASSTPPAPPPGSVLATDPTVAPLLRVFTDRFGLDDHHLSSFRYRRSGRRFLMAFPEDHRPGLPFDPFSTGLAILRINGRTPKPTTRAAIAFGHAALRNRVLLDREQSLRFVSGLDSHPQPAGSAGITSPGWVLVAHGRITLGVGIAVPTEVPPSTDSDLGIKGSTRGSWVIESLYPKHFAGLSRSAAAPPGSIPP